MKTKTRNIKGCNCYCIRGIIVDDAKLNELILEAKETYQKTSELLMRGDYFDATEKGWCAVELMRKALLVAVSIPLEKAKNLEFSMPNLH